VFGTKSFAVAIRTASIYFQPPPAPVDHPNGPIWGDTKELTIPKKLRKLHDT
jgi:hypothetical protein